VQRRLLSALSLQLRTYEKLGLIKPRWTMTGQREYDLDDLDQARRVVLARQQSRHRGLLNQGARK